MMLHQVINAYVLAGGGSPPAGFQLVGVEAFVVGAVVGSVVETLPEGEGGRTIQEGDFVIVLRASDGGPFAGALDIVTSGYTNAYDTGGTTPGGQIDYKFMGASPDSSVEIGSYTGRRQAGIISVWRGVNTSSPLDVAITTATGASGMPNAPSITPTTDGCMIFAAGLLDDDDAAASVTVPSGYGGLIAGDTGLASTTEGATVMLANFEQATAAAIDAAAFGGTGNDQWAAVALALRPAV